MDYAMPRSPPSGAKDLPHEVPSPSNPSVSVRREGAPTGIGAVINAIVDALAELGVHHIEIAGYA